MSAKSLFFALSFSVITAGAVQAAAVTLSDTVVCNTQVFNVPEAAGEQGGFLAGFCSALGSSGVLINLTEVVGSTTIISDQLWSQAGLFYFVSDNDPSTLVPNAVPTGFPITAVTNIPETGGLQDLSQYFAAPAGYIQVQSDLDAPEPNSMILAVSALVLLGIRRRLSRA